MAVDAEEALEDVAHLGRLREYQQGKDFLKQGHRHRNCARHTAEVGV